MTISTHRLISISRTAACGLGFLLVLLVGSLLGAPSTRSISAPASITIAADGSGTYRTLQEAIDAIPAYPHFPYDIHILPGTYVQQVTIPRMMSHLHIWGDDPATTILRFNLGAPMKGADGKPIGTFATPSVRFLSDDVAVENLTFENTFGPHGQALAAEVSGDRVSFENCRFLGWQDTLFADASGRNYFHNCYIEGHVDFIFGKSTAVFDHCEIRSKGKGYLTAASTEKDKPFGYVFLHCKLTADAGVAEGSVYLGRPWRPYAATAFIECEIGPQIRPEGWFNWSSAANEKTARYAEYGNTGPGAATSKRVRWAKQLSDDEANAYALETVLEGIGKWTPNGVGK